MGSVIFIKEYVLWHYGRALLEIFELLKNFLWFGYHLFSIPLLFKTLVAPFYRMKEKSRGVFDPGTIFGNLLINTIMRLVGFMFRVSVIAAGFAFEIILIIAFLPLFFLWLALPLSVPILILFGFILIF